MALTEIDGVVTTASRIAGFYATRRLRAKPNSEKSAVTPLRNNESGCTTRTKS